MRREQKRVRSTEIRADMSLVRANHELIDDQTCPTPDTESRPDEVDALVDAFLDELTALSGECGIVSTPSSATTAPQEAGIGTGAGVSSAGSVGIVLPSEPEATPFEQNAEFVRTPDAPEVSQSNVAGLTPPLEKNAGEAGRSLTEPPVPHESSLPIYSSAAEAGADEPLDVPPAEPPNPAAASPSLREDMPLSGLFQGARMDRPLLCRGVILAVLSIAGLAAGYFFFGFTKPIAPKSDRSNAQPTPAAPAPARADLPGESEMPIWPAGSDELPIPRTGVTMVQPDAGVLQIVQPVAIKKVMPHYPKEARGLAIDGPVEIDVSADLDDKGHVLRATAMEGPEIFRSAAEEALMKWSFKPAADKGVNIRSTVRVTIVFNP